MSSEKLFRLSGWAGILAALFGIIALLFNTFLARSAFQGTFNILPPIFTIFLFMGIYFRQREQSGLLGIVGFILLFIAGLLTFGKLFSAIYIFPALNEDILQSLFEGATTTSVAIMVSSIIGALGFIVFGCSILKAKRFPALAAWLFMIGFLPIHFAFILPNIYYTIGNVMIAVANFWFGYTLVKSPEKTS